MEYNKMIMVEIPLLLKYLILLMILYIVLWPQQHSHIMIDWGWGIDPTDYTLNNTIVASWWYDKSKIIIALA